MKSVINIVIILLLALPLQAQHDIKTHSVTLQNFINFVAEKYDRQDPENQSIQAQNITFLIQVPNKEMAMEDLVILKQGFKLLSERLNDSNSISILTYFGYNGAALELSSATDLPKVYNALENLKSKISEFQNDGIDYAYRYTKEHYNKDANNTIVIIRNPNILKTDVTTLSRKEIKKIKRKQKKKDILKVAVSLVPEIIAILKN